MQNKSLRLKKRITCAIAVVFLLLTIFSALVFSTSQEVLVSAEQPVWSIENGKILSYSGDETEITVPSEYQGEPVTAISEKAFFDNKTVEKIIVPDSIKEIGNNAFQKCTNLKEVELGDGITDISDYAFEHCVSLEKINIPNSVKVIGTWAFGFCTSLKEIEFPYGLENIGSASFYSCSKLEKIVMPDSVTDIGTHSFRACTNLSSVTFSNSLKSVPYRAFDGCPIKEVNLPSSVKTIGLEAFYEAGVEKVTLSNQTEKIDDRAFFGARKLKEINLPENLSYLGESAFEGCSILRRITIPNGISIIKKNTFSGCVKLTSVVLPQNLTQIEEGAFSNCDRLVEVFNLSSLALNKGSEQHGKVAYNARVVHNSIEKSSLVFIDASGFIFYDEGGERATFLGFSGVSTKLELPNSINDKPYDIDKYAFKNETNILSITIPICVKRIEDNAFYGVNKALSVAYAGNWTQWQLVSIGEGNECLDTILFFGSDKETTNQDEVNVSENGGLSFLDRVGNVLNELKSIIVSNMFAVNFLLVLFWGIILIYNGNREKNKKIFVIIVCIQWILISGLRADSVGADTENYMNFFDYHAKLSWRSVFVEIKNYFTAKKSSEAYLGVEPLFILFNKLVSVITLNHVIYKFIVAIIFTTALGRYIYKYSEDPCLSFAIYGSLFYNMFSLTGYRQVLAVALILFGYKFVRERKFVPYLILVLVGSLFHKTTLMFILFYVLANKKLTPNYIMTLLAIFVTMLIFNRQIFVLVKGFFGYDEYVGNYGFKQLTFTVLYIALTAVAFWKFKEITSRDQKALQYYNGLLLSWIMFPFVLESPSALRLVYNFGFVILPLTPLIVKSFKTVNERSIVYLAIYLLFFAQVLTSGFTYSFFWM